MKLAIELIQFNKKPQFSTSKLQQQWPTKVNWLTTTLEDLLSNTRLHSASRNPEYWALTRVPLWRGLLCRLITIIIIVNIFVEVVCRHTEVPEKREFCVYYKKTHTPWSWAFLIYICFPHSSLNFYSIFLDIDRMSGP